jgi:hypothetical protein
MSVNCSRKIMYHRVRFGTTIFKTTLVEWFRISTVPLVKAYNSEKKNYHPILAVA